MPEVDIQLLLIVEDCFDLRRSNQGLVVTPEVPWVAIPELKAGKTLILPVILKFPDRTNRQVSAQFYISHFTPGGFKKICSFQKLVRNEVPIGTEIWLIE